MGLQFSYVAEGHYLSNKTIFIQNKFIVSELKGF